MNKSVPIETTELCSYGCGQVAKFKLGNGKLCCSKSWQRCPSYSKQNKTKHIPTPVETTKLCSYGCGQIAKYKFKSGKLCCSNHYSKCPISRKKTNINNKFTLIETIELCSYGCGQLAKYKLKNGKLCCSKNIVECSATRKKLRGSHKLISIETTKLCSYGCGQVANFKLSNEKLCCEDNIMKCPINIKKNKDGQKPFSIEKIKERYTTFYKVEDLRYNPENPNEIQVRCNNHKCKNSKENNGWFTPTISQIYQRIYQIEKPWGNDGAFFYCSEECKDECILFNLKGDPFKKIISPHTSQEINIWRKECFKRQKDEYGYNFCEMCESKENLQVHHEKPQKTHPGMTLDPDNGIILCKKCHYKYGHKTGTPCSTGNLAHNPCD